MKTVFILAIFILALFTSQNSYAQEDSLKIEADTVVLETKKIKKQKIKKERSGFLFKDSTGISKPARAALLSAGFPGLGQLYTKKAWFIRLPIVYGLGGFMGYLINSEHKRYVELRDAYLYALDNNPITVPDSKFNNYNSASLKRNRDNYRRNRDYYAILSIGVYVLNIAEAATMAHINEFDVSDDLAFKIEPTFQAFQGVPTAGIAIIFPIGDKKKIRSQQKKLYTNF